MRSLPALLLTGLTALVAVTTLAAEPVAADIRAALKRSADWHLANPSGIDTRDWVIAPLYDGLLRTATTTGDAKYLAAVLRFGTQAGWMPANRIYHADDHAVGHAWLDVYFMDPTQKLRLTPIKNRLDYVIANPVTEALAHGSKPATPGVSVSDRWTWCDALYMAPPTLTRLYAATGDKKYLDFLDREFRYTYDHLYDPAERLFFRDATFFDKKTPAGKKTFWSRGNGWVYGGLALLLEHLPADHPTRGFYEKVFKEMTTAILAVQQPDGLWHPSMLDAAQVPVGETSGSGFFVFGLAWGVNHGLLDRATHWPAITRGWAGLMSRTKPDGYVGYVQPIGAAPGALTSESVQDYGTGAFLLAGSEILRALGGAAAVKPADLLAQANAVIASEAKTPRAYARLVPERADDLAWENDRVAFRVYGPALRKGPEDSGIDVWCKRVPYPIIDKWYHQDLNQKLSYHKDHGEGYDGYKVGDTRGCGSLGLWIDGKLVTPDTYTAAIIYWTAPSVAEFRTIYTYPVKLKGKPLYEHRITRLRLGSRLSEVIVYFSHDSARRAAPIADFPHEIAIGLVTQNPGAQFTLDAASGLIAVYEQLDGKNLGTGVVLDPKQVLRTDRLAATDKDKKHEHALIFTKVGADGRAHYRTGFAWAGDGDLTTAEQWLAHLRQPLPPIAPHQGR
jgi:unsaturated rhamnogalacturonyl hydrolase